jgi:hypothetical protein
MKVVRGGCCSEGRGGNSSPRCCCAIGQCECDSRHGASGALFEAQQVDTTKWFAGPGPDDPDQWDRPSAQCGPLAPGRQANPAAGCGCASRVDASALRGEATYLQKPQLVIPALTVYLQPACYSCAYSRLLTCVLKAGSSECGYVSAQAPQLASIVTRVLTAGSWQNAAPCLSFLIWLSAGGG